MWGKEGIGILGWLTTPLPLWAYRLAWIPTLFAGGIAIAGGILRRPRAGARAAAVSSHSRSRRSPTSSCCITRKRRTCSSNGNRLLQGRYFLPVYPLVAVAVMAGISRFGERVAVASGLVVLAAWTIVDLDALNTVAVYFG